MSDKILIIDDEVAFTDLMRTVLSKKGYSVEVANSGSEALEKAAVCHAPVVLLDYMLPDISGLDLLPRLKTISPSCKIIVITARGSEEIAVELMKAGASDYLRKPFESEKLILKIENVLRLKSSEAANEKLNRELMQQNKELLSLHAMSGLLASNISELEKYASAVGIVLKNMNADMVHLFTYSDDRSLRLLASEGTGMESIQECASREKGLASYVADIKKPAVVSNFREEKRFKIPREILDRGLESGLAVPLFVKNSLKGVLAVYGREVRSYTSFEMKLLGNFGNQIATAMELDYLTGLLGNFQRQWQVTFDAVPERITVQDADHMIVMANKAAADVAGLKVMDIIGQRCSWIFHSRKDPIDGCPVSEAIRTKEPVRKKVEAAGESFDISAYPVLDKGGNVILVTEYVRKTGVRD